MHRSSRLTLCIPPTPQTTRANIMPLSTGTARKVPVFTGGNEVGKAQWKRSDNPCPLRFHCSFPIAFPPDRSFLRSARSTHVRVSCTVRLNQNLNYLFSPSSGLALLSLSASTSQSDVSSGRKMIYKEIRFGYCWSLFCREGCAFMCVCMCVGVCGDFYKKR